MDLCKSWCLNTKYLRLCLWWRKQNYAEPWCIYWFLGKVFPFAYLNHILLFEPRTSFLCAFISLLQLSQLSAVYHFTCWWTVMGSIFSQQNFFEWEEEGGGLGTEIPPQGGLKEAFFIRKDFYILYSQDNSLFVMEFLRSKCQLDLTLGLSRSFVFSLCYSCFNYWPKP